MSQPPDVPPNRSRAERGPRSSVADAQRDDHPPEDGPDELAEDDLLEIVDRAAPSEHQLAGGAPRELVIILLVGSLLGLWASVELVRSEILLAEDPFAALACDINPLIGCGSFITTWQARALGVSNAIIGTGAFGALLAVALMWLSGGRAGRWFWRLLVVGAVFALVALVFFAYTAFHVVHALCPYCLVVWLAIVPVIVHVPARAAQAGHVPLGERLTRTLVLDRWLITGVLYGVIVLYALFRFWDQWMLMLS